MKAAWTYDAKKAVGLDGALAKLVKQSYGGWLLCVRAGTVPRGLTQKNGSKATSPRRR